MGDKMPLKKQWIFNEVDESRSADISKELGISGLLAEILTGRGMKKTEEIRNFLNPSPDMLHDPLLMKDMDKAVGRIIKAAETKEKIYIYGDYDVDGITSTSIMYNFLKGLDADAQYYIPDRMDEGYGLSINAARIIAGQGASLVVTVDCGITAIEEVKFLMDAGIDVVITDHHECGVELPSAFAAVNPNRPDCSYPFKALAGVGVVYKVVTGICKTLGLAARQDEFLGLVALGTVADVVPLIDENRVIVKFGIEKIREMSDTGIRALAEVSGLAGKPVNTWGLAFGMAPRVNAAGRMGDAERAVRLFTTGEYSEAKEIAELLDSENKSRQAIEAEIMNLVIETIAGDPGYEDDKILVAAGEGWHHGIVGIVASKITERYSKPCIIISFDGELAKGSGRSVEGFSLYEAIKHCEHLLVKFGGHEMAAGLTLKTADITSLREEINKYADTYMEAQHLVPKLKIDLCLKKEDISISNIKELEMLEPFGPGNTAPVFAYRNISVSSLRTLSEGRHLKLKLVDGGLVMEAIGFNMGQMATELKNVVNLDVAGLLEVNTWNSMGRIQMNLRDLGAAGASALKAPDIHKLDKSIDFVGLKDDNKNNNSGNYVDINASPGLDIMDVVPERNDLAAVYQFLKSGSESDLIINDLFSYSERVSEKYGVKMNCFKLKKSFQIFEELNLLNCFEAGENGIRVALIRDIKFKSNLESSRTYIELQRLKNPG